MKRFVKIFVVVFLFYSCNVSRESLPAPDAPKIVPVSDPLSVEDYGSGAIPENDGIKIVWRSVKDANGYKVYRGEEKDSKPEFKFYYDVRAQAGKVDTFYIDLNVEFRKRYYYFITAYNRDNVESKSSDTLVFELYLKPRLVFPTNNVSVSPDSVIFQWDDPNGGGDFVVRVLNAEGKTIWIYQYRSFSVYSVRFNVDGKATQNLVSGRQYKWRVDRVQFGQNAGSKSVWGIFNVK